MATATSKAKVDNEPDLLAEIEETTKAAAPAVEDEDFDLLSDMSESDAIAWVPWNDQTQPNGVQGVVVHIGTVTQDVKYGGDEVPYIEVRDSKDSEKIWGIRGYSTVLEAQMQKQIDDGLKNGDVFAVVFKGVVTSKGGNEYKSFVARSKRN